MIEHFALELCNMFEQLTVNTQSLASLDGKFVLHPEYVQSLARTGLQRVLNQDKRFNFGPSVMLRAGMLHQLMIGGQETYTAELLLKDLQSIMMELIIVLSARKFAYIPPTNASYFEQEKLFGEDVHAKFENARAELKDAGNCLAADLPTACVFHLMRVAEHGLRDTAKKVRVRLTDKGRPQPIEFATWDKVIQGISKNITAARALPHGPRKNQRLQFYSSAADQCTYIRDLWRNDVSHTRKRYNNDEAIGIFGRVRDFMQLLAKGIS